jgi:magnesium-transporting ATPase (P-type)
MSDDHGDEKKDLENGDPKRERISFADGWDPDKDEGEYANLIRYISTYRDRRFSKAPSQASGDDKDASKERKVPWYKRMFGIQAGAGELYQVPEEWLTTDIKQGLTSAEVEERRRKTGFNELASEKENMLLKFLGYFQGPILYSTYTRSTPSTRMMKLTLAQLWNLLSVLQLVSKTGSISVSSSAFSCSTPLSAGTKKSKLPMSSLV